HGRILSPRLLLLADKANDPLVVRDTLGGVREPAPAQRLIERRRLERRDQHQRFPRRDALGRLHDLHERLATLGQHWPDIEYLGGVYFPRCGVAAHGISPFSHQAMCFMLFMTEIARVYARSGSRTATLVASGVGVENGVRTARAKGASD